MKPIKNLSSRRSSASSRLAKSTIAALAAGAILFGTIAPVSAHTFQEVIEYKINVLKCALLLFTDPVAHLEVCGEGDISQLRSLSAGSFNDPIKETCPDGPYEMMCLDEMACPDHYCPS